MTRWRGLADHWVRILVNLPSPAPHKSDDRQALLHHSVSNLLYAIAMVRHAFPSSQVASLKLPHLGLRRFSKFLREADGPKIKNNAQQ